MRKSEKRNTKAGKRKMKEKEGGCKELGTIEGGNWLFREEREEEEVWLKDVERIAENGSLG